MIDFCGIGKFGSSGVRNTNLDWIGSKLHWSEFELNVWRVLNGAGYREFKVRQHLVKQWTKRDGSFTDFKGHRDGRNAADCAKAIQ